MTSDDIETADRISKLESEIRNLKIDIVYLKEKTEIIHKTMLELIALLGMEK